MPSKKKSNQSAHSSAATTASYGALALRAAVVVALAAWAALSVEPLLHGRHLVDRHDHQPSPYHIRNAQGLWLNHAAWLPSPSSSSPSSPSSSSSSDLKGVMFYVHGFGDHCGRYHEFAELWNNNSFAFFCLDHQGHGQSEGERVFIEKFDDYISDYAQFMDAVLEKHPQLKDLPRFLSGTSMGGTIATLLANERPTFFNGVVLLAPGIIPDPRSAAPWQIEAAKFFSHYVPKLKVGALDDDNIVADKDRYRAFMADPLAYKGYVTARWGAEMLGAMDRIKSDAATKTAYPFLIIYGTDDIATNMAGGDYLVQHAVNSKDKKAKYYENWKHALLQEPARQILFDDVVEWVLARL